MGRFWRNGIFRQQVEEQLGSPLPALAFEFLEDFSHCRIVLVLGVVFHVLSLEVGRLARITPCDRLVDFEDFGGDASEILQSLVAHHVTWFLDQSGEETQSEDGTIGLGCRGQKLADRQGSAIGIAALTKQEGNLLGDIGLQMELVQPLLVTFGTDRFPRRAMRG